LGSERTLTFPALVVRAWRAALIPGAVVAFHDYGHPEHPGVRDAIPELGLAGAETNGIFIWHAS